MAVNFSFFHTVQGVMHSVEIFRGFLKFRFYVKLILESFEVLKLPFFHFRGSEFCQFGQFQPAKSAKIHKMKILNL